MASRRNHRRTGAVAVLSAFLIGAVFGLTACSGDGEPSALPSGRAAERSIERPSAEPETKPETTPTSTTPRPTRSRQPAQTTAAAEPTVSRSSSPAAAEPSPSRTATTRPPTSAAVAAPAPSPTQTTRTTTPPQTAPAPAPAAAESTGIGPWGWFVVLVLVAAMIVGGFLVYRAQRKSAWDGEARAVEAETRTVIGTRLPPVLTTTVAAQRDLVWLPVRAALTELADRWNALAERAVGEPRRNWSLRLSGLLQDLVAAVDAESEAIALGRDWTLLRPRVNRVEDALAGALSGAPQPEPPAAGEPGPPAMQT